MFRKTSSQSSSGQAGKIPVVRTGLARRVSLLFLVFSVVWIIGTSQMALVLSDSVASLAYIETFKGLVFVSLSAILIYVLIQQEEQELRASEERFRLLYDNTPSMFFTVAADGRILSVNEFAATQLGFSKEELKQYSANMLQHPDDRELTANMNAELLKTPGQIQRYEIRLLRKDGSYLWVRKTVRATEDPGGDGRFLVVCEDITEARQLSEELNYQASHDMLTGLANRREFEKRLGRLLESTRAGEHEHILMYMDLDNFKVVNDICGHVAGDELLRQLGDLLKTQIRRGDTVARLGGDEFGLLFEHCGRDKGIKIAENVLHEIQTFRFVWDDKSFSMTASIGLVCINSTSTTTPEIMSAADTACYAAKDAGRNRVQMYYDSDTELSRRRGEIQWVSRINQALNEDRFYLVAQEIIPVAAESDNVYLELLLRMRDETGQMVPPGAFLPAAERYKLSASIDRWVIKTALEWLQATPDIARHLSFCSINISGLSLGNEDFLDYVDAALKSSHIAGDNLCFEITETAAIINLANARRFMQILSARGCKFALDDFGTGLSSFAYLKNLPVDYLKIDGGFVRDMVTDKIDRAMVRSINEIGHVMGKKTIAEFVENDEILAILRQLGVDYAQGYGIARPLPLAEFRPLAARK
ncbi:MAG: EAL domain-containing protein [Gammaproteobacteria bacterium]